MRAASTRALPAAGRLSKGATGVTAHKGATRPVQAGVTAAVSAVAAIADVAPGRVIARIGPGISVEGGGVSVGIAGAGPRHIIQITIVAVARSRAVAAVDPVPPIAAVSPVPSIAPVVASIAIGAA